MTAIYGGIAVVTLVTGLAAAVDPVLALAVLIGLGVLAVVVTNVTAGVMVFAAVPYVQAASDGAFGASSMAKFVGLFLVAGWLGAMVLDRSHDRGSRDLLTASPGLALLLALFLSWSTASLLWSEDTAVAREVTIRFALTFVLFPIVVAAIRTERAVVCLYGIMIGGALAATAMAWGAVVQPGESRLGGDGFNSNELGLYLIAATVLAVTLACMRSLSVAGRLVALLAAVARPIALVLTGSRGSFVGLAVALVVAPLVVGRGRRLPMLAVVASIAVTGIVMMGAFASNPSVKRVMSLGSEGGSGRIDLWTIGLRILDDKPVTGVGAGNFEVSSIHYLLVPGTIVWDEYIVDKPQVPHNIYLQVLTELGVVGLALFVAIIGSCLLCALRAARLFRSRGSPGLEILTRGLFVALVGMLAAGFFSSQLYNKQLYLMLAMAPALLAMASRLSEREQL